MRTCQLSKCTRSPGKWSCWQTLAIWKHFLWFEWSSGAELCGQLERFGWNGTNRCWSSLLEWNCIVLSARLDQRQIKPSGEIIFRSHWLQTAWKDHIWIEGWITLSGGIMVKSHSWLHSWSHSMEGPSRD